MGKIEKKTRDFREEERRPGSSKTERQSRAGNFRENQGNKKSPFRGDRQYRSFTGVPFLQKLEHGRRKG